MRDFNLMFMAFFAIFLMVFSCSTVVQDGAPPAKGEVRDMIKEVVKGSSCASYAWKNRGVAPLAYMNGMALMYAKQVCGQGSEFIKPDKITGNYKLYSGPKPYQDALAYYGISGGELNTYTFLIGLGMRESSGRYATGRDYTRNFIKSDSAEAGLFQMAYVARVFNKELEPLYKDFASGKRSCELATFKDEKSSKTKSTDSKTYGTGEGAEWQKLMKRCPAASAAWAAILVRSQLRHFGPIIRKEVEYRNDCREMLKKVEAIAKPRCAQL